MASLSTQTISSTTGNVITTTACAAGGDTFANDGMTWIEITNGHATDARTITVDAISSVNVPGLGNITLTDTAMTVAAQTTRRLGPFPKARFNNAAGRASISYSNSAADLTIAVIKLKAENDA